ncbi:S24 family peptidase [Acinetobacter haemolyticus]|uniref:Helix-turn-helix domain-containing protein n=1 Tax=Acinetobacter haemolyticus TaxID=29430 RepID=A0A4P7B221_ACIHA|nr:S24 family peptidase [Acinetobacter haemolyticus]QBQ15592.1 helix-turn-helix domain-containing protein [Acinetobacter haemolyticus]
MASLQERMFQAKQHYEKNHGKKLKNTEMADFCKVSKASVGQWFNGPTQELDGSNLSLAAEFLGVNHKWLAGERAPMLLTDKNFSNVVTDSAPFIKIPVLDYVQAGVFGSVGYDGINPIGETYTTYRPIRHEDIFSLKVEGDSMLPTFKPGDSLVIDASLAPKPGSFVIAQNGNIEATFKKYRITGYDQFGREEFELVPLNPDYPTFSSKDHNITIIGVMVRHTRDYN